MGLWPIQPRRSSPDIKGKWNAASRLSGGGEKEIFGVIAIADGLRSEAKEAVQKLKKIGIEQVVMLTGDNEGTAKAIAQEARVDTYFARLLPEDRVEKIWQLLMVS